MPGGWCAQGWQWIEQNERENVALRCSNWQKERPTLSVNQHYSALRLELACHSACVVRFSVYVHMYT